MRVAVLGRTDMMLESVRRLVEAGHQVPLVGTCRSSGVTDATEEHFQREAATIGADFFCSAAINSPAILDKLRAAHCDVAVSMNWASMIGAEARAAFRHGVYNAHPGDLPRYRGNACPNWAILNGEKRVSFCIHQMDDQLDGGPVAIREHLPIGPTTDMTDVYAWLRRQVPDAFLRLVDAIAAGKLILTPQPADPQLALRCYPRRPEDSRIDWSRSSAEIDLLVRASARPMQGAWTMLEGQRRVIVWRARPFMPPSPFLAIPGQVCFKEDDGPVIACGAGMLKLVEIALDGQPHDLSSAAALSSLRNRLI